jgi:hypothetical protein
VSSSMSVRRPLDFRRAGRLPGHAVGGADIGPL